MIFFWLFKWIEEIGLRGNIFKNRNELRIGFLLMYVFVYGINLWIWSEIMLLGLVCWLLRVMLFGNSGLFEKFFILFKFEIEMRGNN